MVSRTGPEPQSGSLPPRLLQWCVDACYGIFMSMLPPYAAFRLLTDGKARARWHAYARHLPSRVGRRRPRERLDRPCIWVHGVSVGEVKAAASLVEHIERVVPGVEIVVSATTDTGFDVARSRYPRHRVEYYPPDASWIVNDALDAIRPDLIILVESEFWPNFLCAVRERRLPVVLVNGKISARSARRFGRLPALSHWLMSSIDRAFVQMPVYAERFLALGMDPQRLVVTGNMKLDNIPIKTDDRRRERFARLFGVSDGVPLIVAGSTHPGEERTLARFHRELATEGRDVRMVIAPRHPGRRESVEADLKREGRRAVRRSALDGTRVPAPDEIVLLDTVGELEAVYALADLVFVGGTLVPHGGQNMMEPASLGRPVVVGPYVSNFRGEVALLVQAEGLALCNDARAVAATLRRWLDHPAEAAATGQRAREAIADSKGATWRTCEGLEPVLSRLAARYPPGGRIPADR